jgi:glyoxylase-like metal-dependent hydrolase (beta-lactamase superfamily II)
MDGNIHPGGSAQLVCHCLLIETDADGLVLIDTGLGLRDVVEPNTRLSPLFRTMMRLPLRESETAIRQIEKLGFTANDVRHIVLTHLDFDHAGGLDDFPDATVHLLAAEQTVATERRTWLDRRRFRPQQWHYREQWTTYAPAGERWLGFDCVRSLRNVAVDILLLPLPGHTRGHAGVAVAHADRWLLHCGDAYFHRDEMNAQRPRCPPGLRLYQTLMEQDRGLRLENQRRLRELAAQQSASVQVFCAHDQIEFERARHASVATMGAPSDRPGGSQAAKDRARPDAARAATTEASKS